MLHPKRDNQNGFSRSAHCKLFLSESLTVVNSPIGFIFFNCAVRLHLPIRIMKLLAVTDAAKSSIVFLFLSFSLEYPEFPDAKSLAYKVICPQDW